MTDEGIQQLFASVQSHHLKVNGLVVLIVAAFLALCGVFYLHSEHAYQAAIAKADVREAAYLQRMDDLQKSWADTQKQLVQLSSQQAQVRTQVVYRDRQAQEVVKAVLAPDRGEEQVSQDVQAAYSFPSIDLVDHKFTFDVHQVQTFVATKLDRDRLAADLADTKLDLGLEQQKTAKLTTNFEEAKVQLGEANKVVDGYKNAAKKTRWARVKDSAVKVALLVGGIYLGRHI